MTGRKSGLNEVAPKAWVDPDDAPELDDAFFERADLYHGAPLIRRGRPRAEKPKAPINIRLFADVLDAFKRGGRGWQGRIDSALAQWLEEHAPAGET